MRIRDDSTDSRSAPSPPFDWRAEQSAQKRDLARFASDMIRALTLRGGSPAARQMSERVRERWEQLIRRLEGRWARSSEISDRQAEQIERLSAEHATLQTLLSLDDAWAPDASIETIMSAALFAMTRAVPADGAVIYLSDISGRPRRAATERRKGRPWPPASDHDMCELILHSASEGRRIMLEGRPVKSTPRDPHRVAHWLAVGISFRESSYGALVFGRTTNEEPFSEDQAATALRVGNRLGLVLASRLGTGARPAPGGGNKPAGFDHIWGEAPALRRAIELAERLAGADTPVVIEGELGTGRETLARAIHGRSPRSKKPFVVFRGSDLPEETIARGLFGTSAADSDGRTTEQPGDIELAEGGMLFIDDLSAIDLVLQVRLIRLLSEGVFERVGDRTPRAANVRLIVATTEDVDDALARGRLRSDLYYQITAGRIALPPLRERGNDIIELARRFAVSFGQKSGSHIEGVDLEAARILESSSFPGNIRQLSQIIERAVLLAHGQLIAAADLPRELAARTMPTSQDSTTWSQQAASAVRQASEAGHSGDYRLFRRARRLAQSALDASFAHAVLRAVGKHPTKAAAHAGMHRAQWWRLWRAVHETGTAQDRNPAEPPKSRQESQQR